MITHPVPFRGFPGAVLALGLKDRSCGPASTFTVLEGVVAPHAHRAHTVLTIQGETPVNHPKKPLPKRHAHTADLQVSCRCSASDGAPHIPPHAPPKRRVYSRLVTPNRECRARSAKFWM